MPQNAHELLKLLLLNEGHCRSRVLSLDLQLYMQSVPITTNILGLNAIHQDLLDTTLHDKVCH